MLVQGLFAAVVIVAVPMLCVFVGFAPEVVRIVSTPKFDEAAGVLRLLVVAVAFSFGAGVFFTALIAVDQQGPLARRMMVVLAFNVALNVVLIGPLAARGAALALILSEIASLALAWQLFERTGQSVRLRLPLRLGAAGLVCGAVVAGIRLLVSEPAGSPFLVLLGGSAVAVLAFAGAVIAFRALPIEVTSALGQLRARRAAEPADESKV
jgi:O-antigen/teichoic acid export membrane protein